TPPWAKVCCREALPTTMERARRTMRKTAVRPIGEPFYGFRKDPGRRPLQHSAVPARRLVSVLIEKFSSASFRRRPAGGEWARPRPEHPHRAGGDMYFQVRLDKGNCHEWIRRKQKRIKTLKNRILPGSIVDW
ncbi:hypothetical protein AB2C97_32470, partial [Pseudomonas aeruginosa]